MKTLFVLLGMAGTLSVAGYLYLDTTVEVIKETVTVTETVTEEDKYGNLDKLITEAIQASQGDIETKLDTYRAELEKEIEDQIKSEYILDLEDTISTNDY